MSNNVNYAGRIKRLISNLESNGYSWQIYIHRNGHQYFNTEYTIETLSELKSDETARLHIWRGRIPTANVVIATYDMKQQLGYIDKVKVLATSDEELDDIDGLINNPTGEQLSFF